MGRNRINQNEIKVKISISIKKCIIEEIKGKQTNLSEYIEKLIETDLNRD